MPHKMTSIIVAMDEENGIGKDNIIPWNEPADRYFFHQSTCANETNTNKNVVIMGRKTWESLPKKPLYNRHNVVLSRTISTNTLEETIKKWSINKYSGRIWIIGGGEIYKECIDKKLVDYLYITHIPGKYNCNIFFPKYNDTYVKIYETNLGEGEMKRSVWLKKNIK